MILPRKFYARDSAKVAKELLGKELRMGKCAGRIVETEAYYGLGDPGSHAFRGPTPRSRIMWEKPGTVYTYFCYGAHWLLNIVTEASGRPGAVLIRALEPLSGEGIMRKRRQSAKLCDGPAKLTQALGITGKENGSDATKGPITVHGAPPVKGIGRSGRIGLSKGGKRQLRFFIKGSAFLSK